MKQNNKQEAIVIFYNEQYMILPFKNNLEFSSLKKKYANGKVVDGKTIRQVYFYDDRAKQEYPRKNAYIMHKNKNLVLGKYKRYMSINGFRYKLLLITQDYVFYNLVDTQDVIMYDRNMKIISDNYFGQVGFINEIVKLYPTKSWVWADNNTKKYAGEIYQDYIED